MSTMSDTEAATRRLYEELVAGDAVEVTHEVKVGLTRWYTTTNGTVQSKQRRRHGLHHRRSSDDKVFSDVLVLEQADGSLTTVTMDEFTRLRRA